MKIKPESEISCRACEIQQREISELFHGSLPKNIIVKISRVEYIYIYIYVYI